MDLVQKILEMVNVNNFELNGLGSIIGPYGFTRACLLKKEMAKKIPIKKLVWGIVDL